MAVEAIVKFHLRGKVPPIRGKTVHVPCGNEERKGHNAHTVGESAANLQEYGSLSRRVKQTG